jgi:hypothetical protein
MLSCVYTLAQHVHNYSAGIISLSFETLKHLPLIEDLVIVWVKRQMVLPTIASLRWAIGEDTNNVKICLVA